MLAEQLDDFLTALAGLTHTSAIPLVVFGRLQCCLSVV